MMIRYLDPYRVVVDEAPNHLPPGGDLHEP